MEKEAKTVVVSVGVADVMFSMQTVNPALTQNHNPRWTNRVGYVDGFNITK